MTQLEHKTQKGSLRQVPRANGKFSWEWRYVNHATGRGASKTFKGKKFPEKADIEKHLRPFVARLNDGDVDDVIVDPTVGDLIDCFIAEEHLIEIKERKPGDRSARPEELAY